MARYASGFYLLRPLIGEPCDLRSLFHRTLIASGFFIAPEARPPTLRVLIYAVRLLESRVICAPFYRAVMAPWFLHCPGDTNQPFGSVGRAVGIFLVFGIS